MNSLKVNIPDTDKYIFVTAELKKTFDTPENKSLQLFKDRSGKCYLQWHTGHSEHREICYLVDRSIEEVEDWEKALDFIL